jgi:hypothetical protein
MARAALLSWLQVGGVVAGEAMTMTQRENAAKGST